MTMYTESLRAFLKPVLPFLDDDSVFEIMINGPEDVWSERKGKLTRTDARFTGEGLEDTAPQQPVEPEKTAIRPMPQRPRR